MRVLISMSVSADALKSKLKEVSLKVKYTSAYNRLRLAVDSLRIKISNRRKALKKATAAKKPAVLAQIKKLQTQQEATRKKREDFAKKNKALISSVPVHKLQNQATVLAEKIRFADKKKPAAKAVKPAAKSPVSLKKAHDAYNQLLNSKKPVSGTTLRKARETVLKRRFDLS